MFEIKLEFSDDSLWRNIIVAILIDRSFYATVCFYAVPYEKEVY